MLTRDEIENRIKEFQAHFRDDLVLRDICSMALAHLDDEDKIKKLEAERDAIAETMDTIIEVYKGDLNRLGEAEKVLKSASWDKQSECPFSAPGCHEAQGCYICIANRARSYFADKGKDDERNT